MNSSFAAEPASHVEGLAAAAAGDVYARVANLAEPLARAARAGLLLAFALSQPVPNASPAPPHRPALVALACSCPPR
jgi:hypothetical protein